MEGGPRFEFGRNDVGTNTKAGAFASKLLAASGTTMEFAATTFPMRWPGTAGVPFCAKGQEANSFALPSSCFTWPRRTEHMCAPFFLQQAGTSEEAAAAASAEKIGLAENSNSKRSVVMRRHMLVKGTKEIALNNTSRKLFPCFGWADFL